MVGDVLVLVMMVLNASGVVLFKTSDGQFWSNLCKVHKQYSSVTHL